MSRTQKAKKAPGLEYWSKRPFNTHGQVPGVFAKRRTHKAERTEGKHEAARQAALDMPA